MVDVFVVVLVWAFLACYLLVPFHPLKRGLHDLLAGSVVVYRGSYDAEALGRLYDAHGARRALVVLSGLTVLLCGLALWGVSRYQADATLAPLLRIRKDLSTEFDVRGVQARAFNRQPPKLLIQVFVPAEDFRDTTKVADVRRRAEQRLIASGVDLSPYREVYVSMLTGYTIGIASWRREDTGKPLALGGGLGGENTPAPSPTR